MLLQIVPDLSDNEVFSCKEIPHTNSLIKENSQISHNNQSFLSQNQSLFSHKNPQLPQASLNSSHQTTSNSLQSSILSHTLITSKRLIFKYPDGTHSYAYRCQHCIGGDRKKRGDTWLQVKRQPLQSRADDHGQGNVDHLSMYQVIQIEDEIEFLLNNMEYLMDPERTLNSYYEARIYLTMGLILNLLLEVLVTIYIFKHEDKILLELT